MALFLSQLAAQVSAEPRSYDAEHVQEAGALPLLASPVNPEAYKWLRRHSRQSLVTPGKIKRSMTIAQFEAEHDHGELGARLFRKQSVASILELYFDLFFVANLAVFTNNHAHVDAQSVSNYIGFFSILWTTWFHITIHDCRFYADSVLARMVKMLQIASMVAFVGLGPVYDTILDNGESRAFNGLGLVLMAIRFGWAIQYGFVLYYVRGFQKTVVPLFLMIITYILAGCGFLGVYLADDSDILFGNQGATKVTAWYVIIGIEAILVIVISSIWRVLSFKHTHLVERVGLLTLIVMGEGIIGLLKSTSYILTGTNVSVWGAIGLVSPAVFIIYFIYLLYFGSIHHERFGTVRQQIWALMHYFLHVAILLTVEGQSAMLIWAACREGVQFVTDNFPSISDPAGDLTSTTALINDINNAINITTERYHYAYLEDIYDPKSDIEKLENITAKFGSEEWTESAKEVISNIVYSMQEYIFVNYNAEGPEVQIEEATDAKETVNLYNSGFRTTFEYLYITAGGFLILLAIMFWFGKKGKTKHDYGSIGMRLVIGAGLACVSAVAFIEAPEQTTSFRFSEPFWIIPIITFTYLTVLVCDNLIKIVIPLGHHTNKLSRSSSPQSVIETNTSYEMSRMSTKQNHNRGISYDSEGAPYQGARSLRATSSRYSTIDQHDDEEDVPALGGQRSQTASRPVSVESNHHAQRHHESRPVSAKSHHVHSGEADESRAPLRQDRYEDV